MGEVRGRHSELQQFRAFFHASERILHVRTLPEKLDVVAAGVVEARLFRRCLVSVYQHDRTDDVFFGMAGLSDLTRPDVALSHRTRSGYLEFRESGVDLGSNCFYVPGELLGLTNVLRSQRSAAEFGTWHPDDMFVAYLVSSQGTYLGNLTADDPYDGNIPTSESVRTLSLFAKLAADFLEREFDLRRDPLTHLYNGAYLDELLTHVNADPDAKPLAIGFADLDGLKEVNDRFGHAMGDRFILEAAAILRTVLPDSTQFFRPYGDEFVALVDLGLVPDANGLEERIAAAIQAFNGGERLRLLGFDPFSEEGRDPNYMLGLSAGIVPALAGEVPLVTLQRAETRMYERKEAMYQGSTRRRRLPHRPPRPAHTGAGEI